ncbi:hypothetical protein ADK60_27335, partial [Streptomyces sp. XY431]
GPGGAPASTQPPEAGARPRPPVAPQTPWRIPGPPYSPARLTIGDLITRIAGMPDHLLVVSGVPQWNRRAAWPVCSATWDGALVLRTTAPVPDPTVPTLDLRLP